MVLSKNQLHQGCKTDSALYSQKRPTSVSIFFTASFTPWDQRTSRRAGRGEHHVDQRQRCSTVGAISIWKEMEEKEVLPSIKEALRRATLELLNWEQDAGSFKIMTATTLSGWEKLFCKRFMCCSSSVSSVKKKKSLGM